MLSYFFTIVSSFMSYHVIQNTTISSLCDCENGLQDPLIKSDVEAM